MSKLQNEEDDELMENVTALRRRLMETEKNLHRLQTPTKSANNRYRFTSGSDAEDALLPLTMEDLTPEYSHDNTAMTRGPRSRHTGPLYSSVDMPSFSLHKASSKASSVSTKEFDNEALRIKLQAQRDDNAQLINQNHKLLSQLEHTGYQLHTAEEKLNLLNLELDSARESLPILKHQVSNLKGELSTCDSALITAEQRLNESHHYHAEKVKQFQLVKEELNVVKVQRDEEIHKNKRINNQSEEAQQSLEELNEQLEKYRAKTQQKLQKYQSTEEHLRESLLHCDKEREELLDRATSLEEQIQDLSEEVRILREVNNVEKPALITRNSELGSSIAKQTQLIQHLENSLECSIRDREELQELTSRQNQRLGECQLEVEQSYQQLHKLEEFVQQMQNQMGRGKGDRDLARHQVLKTSTSSLTNSVQSDTLLMCSVTSDWDVNPAIRQSSLNADKIQIEELKMKLAMSEAELQAINSVHQQEGAILSDSGVIDGLRSELMAIVEHTKQGDRKSLALESIIGKLEDDRARTKSELFMLRDQLADSSARNTALKARITQRNGQIVELQNDIEENQTELVSSQRLVKKKFNQIELLEKDLDEKCSALSSHVAKLENLQQELDVIEEQCKNLQKTMDEQNDEMDDATQSIDKIKELNAEQCQELEKQIDMLQNLCQERLYQVEESQQSMSLLRSELAVKEAEVNDLRKKLLLNNKELSTHLTDQQQALQILQEKAYQGSNKVAQLEGALVSCKDQLQKCVEQLEASNQLHEKDIQGKEKEIDTLHILLRELQDNFGDKEREMSGVHQTLDERQLMLSQSINRITELEDREAQLGHQFSQLEKKHSLFECSVEQDTESMEKKLLQACCDLEERTIQVSQLTKDISRMEPDLHDKSERIGDLEEALHQVKKDSENQNQKRQDLESELNRANDSLQQYQQKVKGLEVQQDSSENDLVQYKNRAAEMDSELRQAQGQLHEAFEQLARLQGTLQKSKSNAKSHEEKANKLDQSLRQTHDALKIREKDIEELDDALKSRQRELQQRAAQLAQMNSAIKIHQGEMEERILQLQSALSRTQADLQHRNKQIENLDDTVLEQKNQLKERALQIQQNEQNLKQQQKESSQKNSRITELEKKTKDLQNSLEDQKREMRDQTQQLRLTREQLQRQQIEVAEVRRKTADRERQKDRVERELDETIQLCRNKDSNNVRLAEEAGAAKARETSIQSKLTAELEGLKKQQLEKKAESDRQVAELQDSYAELLASRDHQEASHRLQVQQMQELEAKWLDEMRLAMDQITSLQNELRARKDVIEAANEAILIKEAEVARLSAKISGYERATFGFRLTPTHQCAANQSSLKQAFGTLPNYEHSPRRQMKRSSSDLLLSNLGNDSRLSGVSSLVSPWRESNQFEHSRGFRQSQGADNMEARESYRLPLHSVSPKSHSVAGDLARSSHRQTRAIPPQYSQVDSFQGMLELVNQRIADEESERHDLKINVIHAHVHTDNATADTTSYVSENITNDDFQNTGETEPFIYIPEESTTLQEPHQYSGDDSIVLTPQGDASPRKKNVGTTKPQVQKRDTDAASHEGTGSQFSPPIISLKVKLAKQRALLASSQKSKVMLPGPHEFMADLQERLRVNENRRRKVDRQLFGSDGESQQSTNK